MINMYNAADDYFKYIEKLIYDTYKELIQNISIEFNRFENKFNFSNHINYIDKTLLINNMNKLGKDFLKNIKNISNISNYFHSLKFQELEQLIIAILEKQKKEVDLRDIDHYLFQNHSFKRNKVRKIKGKEVHLTLPVYIRHHFNHKNNNNKNEPPTNEEIDESIKLMIDVIQKLKK